MHNDDVKFPFPMARSSIPDSQFDKKNRYAAVVVVVGCHFNFKFVIDNFPLAACYVISMNDHSYTRNAFKLVAICMCVCLYLWTAREINFYRFQYDLRVKRRKTDEESVFDTNERKRIMGGKRNEEICAKEIEQEKNLRSKREKERERRKAHSFVQTTARTHTHS